MDASVSPLLSEFDGPTVFGVAVDMVAPTREEKWPANLQFDFSKLNFIRPPGVVFLSNLLHWLNSKGTIVELINCDPNTAAISCLDDSLFFEQHCGEKLRDPASPRSTTQPLLKIAQKDSHAWLEANFVPWLASRLSITETSLYAIKVCISELFNNIQDHTIYDIGSIFIQHFPHEKEVSISVSDFGLGIPQKVREKIPDIIDSNAIIQAVQEGFTTKSSPANKGVGLNYLLSVVVLQNGGQVTFYSGKGIVRFERTEG